MIELFGGLNGYADSTVDFGEGITVNNVMATGSTGLVVDLTIAAGATLGPRDVSVTDAVGTTTVSGGFTVTEALTVTISGSTVQGGAPKISIINNDPLSPFDIGTDSETGAPNLGLAFSDPTVNVFNLTVASDAIELLAATDLNAPASVDFTITNGVSADANVDSISLSITPTTPMAFVPGTDLTATLANTNEAAIFSYTAVDFETIAFAPVQTTAGTPLLFLFDDRGTFLSFASVNPALGANLVLAPGATGFVVAYMFEGAGATVTATSAIANAVPAAQVVIEDDANNGTPAGAQAVPALPSFYVNGTFTDPADQDWMAITIDAADAALDLSIVTFGAGDTVIEIYSVDDTDTPIAVSTDQAFLDALLVPAASLGAGDYLVKIAASTFAPPNPIDRWNVAFETVEPPPPPPPFN